MGVNDSMKIRLNEISENGSDYSFDQKTSELNLILKDIIKSEPYSVLVHIQPINSKDYQVSGMIKAQAPEICSLCADDFNLPINKQINEILIPEPDFDRTGRYAKTPLTQLSEEVLNVSHYKGNQFDLGEFIHEAVALEIPFNPRCQACLKKQEDAPFVYDEKMGEDLKPKPFEGLKGLKLN